MGKSSAPVPNPNETSAAQTESNEATAAFNANLNHYDTTGPTGKVSWVNTSPTGPLPHWVQTTSMTPQGQQIYDSQQSGNLTNSNASNNLLNNSLGMLSKPVSTAGLPQVTGTVNGGNLDAARTQSINAAYDSAKQNLDPQFAQQQEQLQSQLAQQGIVQGSDAYNNAMGNFQRQKATAYQQAQDSAVATGNATQNQDYQQGLSSANLQNSAAGQALNQLFSLRGNTINEIQGLRSGSQLNVPSANPGSTSEAAPTNVAGIQQNATNAQIANANAQNQATDTGVSALASIATALLMFA